MGFAAIYADTPKKVRGERRNQVTYLLWNGSLETTFVRAKEAARSAEKILTLAINTFEDVVKKEVEILNKKGVIQKRHVLTDGPNKLAARRRIMGMVYDLHEVKTKGESSSAFKKRTKGINHPLVEKIFNELAPKYAKRIKEVGQGGGYTRVIKLGARRGDNAEMALVELV